MRVPELQRTLVEAAQREEAISTRRDARAAVRRRRVWQRGSRLRVLPLVAPALLGGAAVALASGLISFGTPAASLPVFASPRSGLGQVAPGRVQMLPIAVPDPHGGLPWGMRTISTTRDAGCIQVGRLLDGRLVALGQDEAFGDDGRAHELALSTNIERLNCTLLDAHGRIFDSVTLKSQAASAAEGEHCRPPGTYAPTRDMVAPTCSLADERNLYYGMLGPDATSLTYSSDGHAHTIATVGSDGAYLIVTPGTTHLFTGARGQRDRAGLADSDAVPVFSPITAIHYRGGETCHLLTAERWIYGQQACSPPVPEPFGYDKKGMPTPAQLATAIHARLARDPQGRREIVIHFTSRVAISSLRGEYELQWHEPGMPPNANIFLTIDQSRGSFAGGMIPQGQDIATGQTLTVAIDPYKFARKLASGVARGRVILRYTNGPLIQTAEDTASLPVGSFSIRVP